MDLWLLLPGSIRRNRQAASQLPADDDELKPCISLVASRSAPRTTGSSTIKWCFLSINYLAVDAASGSSMQFFDYLALIR
ncbi:MAG: hypothetical protein R2778_12725 [Saprospiraceae bacterium]